MRAGMRGRLPVLWACLLCWTVAVGCSGDDEGAVPGDGDSVGPGDGDGDSVGPGDGDGDSVGP
ncbi:MAG: hypothetical protein OXU20_24150, partial [Myxococcales bacterium]|nr:hypothetical protein [Myxococcales bacterium]